VVWPDGSFEFEDLTVQLGALDWSHLVGGHGNVGTKEDIRFHNRFLDDLEAAVGSAMASTKFGEVVDD
jgi:hypothetical protein